MIDKNLLQLLGGNRKYIVYTIALMVLGPEPAVRAEKETELTGVYPVHEPL